jgi:hypothetical protein
VLKYVWWEQQYLLNIRALNIKMGLQEVRWEGMDWIALAQVRDRQQALLNAVMKFRVP